MRTFAVLLALLVTAGCGGMSEAERAAGFRLAEVRRSVDAALRQAREQSKSSKFFHFVVLLPKEFQVWRDIDTSGTVNPPKDRIAYSEPVGLDEKGIEVIGPMWMACDKEGKPAWSSPGKNPPTIVLRDKATGARLELRISKTLLEVQKIRYIPPGAKN